jgi:hypothetical protein
MLKVYLGVLIAIILFSCSSEDKNGADIGGVHFEKSTFDEALVLAKKQNKLLLVEFFSHT